MNPKPNTPLFDKTDVQNCFNSKIRQIYRLLNNRYAAKLKKFNLQPSMVSILFTIGKMKKASQKVVADFLSVDESTMSRDIKKLEDLKLLKVVKSDGARQYEITLTDKGYLLVEEIVPIWSETQASLEKLFGQISIQQVDLMLLSLKKQ